MSTRREILAGTGAAGFLLLAGCAGLPDDGAEGRIVTGEALDRVNAFRRAHGREPLRYGRAASKAALEHARTMATNTMMAHNIGFGADFSQRMSRQDVALPAAENIATGQETVARVLHAWEVSESHARNTLDPRFAEVGVAVAFDPANGKEPYWAMVLSGG